MSAFQLPPEIRPVAPAPTPVPVPALAPTAPTAPAPVKVAEKPPMAFALAPVVESRALDVIEPAKTKKTKKAAEPKHSAFRDVSGTLLITTGVAVSGIMGSIGVGLTVGAATWLLGNGFDKGFEVGIIAGLINQFTGIVSVPMIVIGTRLLGKKGAERLLKDIVD